MDLSKLKNLSPILDKAVDLSVFKPDEDQRRAKSNFWSFFASGDILPPADISKSVALRYGGDRRVSSWWDLEGFQDWFSNKDEFRQRIEFLADLALDELQLLIRDRQTNGSAKVAAIKLIMEAGKKVSNKGESEKYLDDLVTKMNKQELEKFIRTRTAKLISPTSDDDESPE